MVMSGRSYERLSFADKTCATRRWTAAPSKMCDFSGATLRGASIRGTTFAFCDFRDADLRDADLTDSRFTNVMTHDRDGGRTDVTGARFEGATLRRVTVEEVIGWPQDPSS
jgi:uncharacterized protein YjbI with pentapeptide repeats